MEWEFEGEVVEWHGPSPYHFVVIPEGPADDIASLATELTYGWGVIPVTATTGRTTWTTSLFPKDGGYLLPVKAAVRRVEAVEVGEVVSVRLVAGR